MVPIFVAVAALGVVLLVVSDRRRQPRSAPSAAPFMVPIFVAVAALGVVLLVVSDRRRQPRPSWSPSPFGIGRARRRPPRGQRSSPSAAPLMVPIFVAVAALGVVSPSPGFPWFTSSTSAFPRRAQRTGPHRLPQPSHPPRPRPRARIPIAFPSAPPRTGFRRPRRPPRPHRPPRPRCPRTRALRGAPSSPPPALRRWGGDLGQERPRLFSPLPRGGGAPAAGAGVGIHHNHQQAQRLGKPTGTPEEEDQRHRDVSRSRTNSRSNMSILPSRFTSLGQLPPADGFMRK